MTEFDAALPWREERLAQIRAGQTLGFIPTMGALHEGHRSLVRRSKAENARTLVSIFVNPLQFDRPDDLTRYPRTLDADRRLCDELDVEAIFAPTVEEMYPTPAECTIDIGHLADHLCGPRRPGHFRGVATVVLKLFGIAQPDRAYFGEKDAQQLAIIRRMVADLNVPLAIVGVPTVREPDGLALSSRNRHLTPAERPLAIHLYRALLKAIMEATAFASKPENRKQIAEAIAPANYLNQPVTVVEQVLTGTYADGLGNVKKDPNRIDFDPFPWHSFAIWIMSQMKRWGQIKGDVDYARVAREVFLATDAMKLMKEVGMKPPTTTSKKFSVMGKEFDPAKPDAYIASFAIKRT